MKPRARYSHHYRVWLCWMDFADDWEHRTIGHGTCWQEALADFIEQRRRCGRYVA